ncbi:MAG: hypothetical protein K8L97_03930 [Anaerolineae bacterium]|nr:hypothetical protein [Anaerolineae bacterium]
MNAAASYRRFLPQGLIVPLLAFLITRLIVFGAAYLSDVALPMITNDEPRGVLDIWNRWDTVWYLEIVEQGYSFTPDIKSSVAFFPLYPLMMSIIGSPLFAGLLISNLCFLMALILLYRLIECEAGNRHDAGRAVFYIATFPTAFFFTAAYTESLFLLLSVAVFYCAREQKWGWAALWGLLGAASRPLGILLWGVVLLEWAQSHGWMFSTISSRESWANLWNAVRADFLSLLVICLIPLGLLVYMLYLWASVGNPVAFWTAQAAWGFQSLGPVAIIIRDLERMLAGELPYFTVLNILAFLVVLGICVPIGRRWGASYAFYTALSVLIPMSSRTESMIRYILVLFPAFMVLGIWGRNIWFDRVYKITCLPFLALFTALFVKGVFIG